MMFRIFQLSIVSALSFSLLGCSSASEGSISSSDQLSQDYGDGSELDDVIDFSINEISDLGDLRELLERIEQENFQSRVVLRLNTDLDFESGTFEKLPPVRELEFFGNNFTIRNLSIVTSGTSNQVGFFQSLKNSSVQNLNFQNVSINADTSVGALAGHINENSTISNVGLSGVTINAKGHAGGLAGQINNDSIVSNLLGSDIQISTTGPQSGGISGNLQNSSQIINSTVSNVSILANSSNNSGGVVGTAYASAQLINVNATNISIQSGTDYVGGAVGSAGTSVVMSNIDVNGVTLSGDRFVGGIAGQTSLNSTIKNSTAENIEISDVGSFAGGLTGNLYSSTIQGSEVNGVNISNSSTHLGGLVGNLTVSSISDSSANNAIIPESSLYAGGAVGFAGTGFEITGLLVENSDIRGDRQIGGLLGRTDTDGSLTQSIVENTKVAASINLVGGAIGYALYDGIFNEIAVREAVVIGNSYVGGVVGRTFSEFKNCYADSTLYRYEGDIDNPQPATAASPNIDRVGGFAGRIETDSAIRKSYSNTKWGNMKIFDGDTNFAPLAGQILTDAVVSNSLFNVGRLGGFVTQANASNWTGAETTNANMLVPQTFIDRGFNTDIWSLPDGEYPHLIFEDDL